VKRDNHHRW